MFRLSELLSLEGSRWRIIIAGKKIFTESVIFSADSQYLVFKGIGNAILKITEGKVEVSNKGFPCIENIIGFSPDSKYLAGIDGNYEYRGLPLLSMGSIRDWDGFITILRNAHSPAEKRILELLNKEEIEKFGKSRFETTSNKNFKKKILAGLNRIIDDRNFYDKSFCSEIKMSSYGEYLLKKGLKNLNKNEVRFFNRLLFEEIFPSEINKIRKLILYDFNDDKYIIPPFDEQKLKINTKTEFLVLNKIIDVGWLLSLEKPHNEHMKDTFTIELWDTLRNIPVKKNESSLVKHPTYKDLPDFYVGGGKIFLIYDKTLEILDLEANNKKIIHIEDDLSEKDNRFQNSYAFSVSRDGNWFCYACKTESPINAKNMNNSLYAKIYNTDSGKIVSTINLSPGIKTDSIAICPKKRLIAIACRKPLQYFGKKGGKIVLYDIINKSIVREMKTE